MNVPAADALMTAADINSDQTARLKQYQQAEQLLIDNGAFIAYSQPLNTQVVKDTIVWLAPGLQPRDRPADVADGLRQGVVLLHFSLIVR